MLWYLNVSFIHHHVSNKPKLLPIYQNIEDRRYSYTKLRIIKNLVVVSLATLFILGSDDLSLTFQSTMNRAKSVGIVSVAIQFAFSLVSSFFLPKYLVLKYGSKKIMILSIILFMPFLVANYYPLYPLMLLTSPLTGIGYSLFWGSFDPYINNLSSLYVDHKLSNLLDQNANVCKERNSSIDRYTSIESIVPTHSFTGPCHHSSNDIGSETNTVSDYNSSNKIICWKNLLNILVHRILIIWTQHRSRKRLISVLRRIGYTIRRTIKSYWN